MPKPIWVATRLPAISTPANKKRNTRPHPKPMRNSLITRKIPPPQVAGNGGKEGDTMGVRARDKPEYRKALTVPRDVTAVPRGAKI